MICRDILKFLVVGVVDGFFNAHIISALQTDIHRLVSC